MKSDRRTFVSGGGLALAAIAGGTMTGLSPTAAASPSGSGTSRTAAFGWEIPNIDNNGADVYFSVINNLTLNVVNIDTAFVVTAAPGTAGFAEVLCVAAVTQGLPQFAPGAPAYLALPRSPDFSSVVAYNPNNLQIGFNGQLSEGVFYSVIMKSWVLADGAGSATSRHVAIAPSLPLTAGNFLVFHMDHAGIPGDCEMQVVLQYTLS
jgi:hypothetical protein